MSRNRRARVTGRASYGAFAGFPLTVLNSANAQRLSAHALALLVDIRSEYNGHNNGRLNATWARLSKKDRWNSKETLNHALKELIHYGFIKREAPGRKIAGAPEPTLYSITWEAVDECQRRGIRLTRVPSNAWREPKPKWQRPPRRRKAQGRNPYLAGTPFVPVRANMGPNGSGMCYAAAPNQVRL